MMFHDLYCPILEDVCRHCSNEGTRRRTKACKLDGKGEIFVLQEISFGLFCNDYCEWIRKMGSCERADKKKKELEEVDYRERSYNTQHGNSEQTTLAVE